ncbi:hypothetical protein GCM10020255_023320 [Rhodococcus baikonurensis]
MGSDQEEADNTANTYCQDHDGPHSRNDQQQHNTDQSDEPERQVANPDDLRLLLIPVRNSGAVTLWWHWCSSGWLDSTQA